VVQVQAATVVEQSISQYVTGDAILSPIAQAAISPKITAPVRKFYVMRGSKVKQGELLVVLDNNDLSAAALDGEGSYEQALAAYNTAVKASIPEIYQRAVLDTEQAKANLDVAQRIYDSRNTLFNQGAIPRRNLDTARASLVQAQSAYDIAKTHLASLKAVSRADALKAAAGQLASAKGKYLGAEALLRYSEIRSPIDGVVTERPLFAGETAPAGTPLITVMDVSTLLAKTHLPQEQARLLKIGQTASVQVDGMSQPVAGTVSLVSPALDPGSTTIEIWVKVPNKDGSLNAGAQASVSIMSKTISKALVIPKEALLTNPSGKRIAMVIDTNHVAHQRDIEAGIIDVNEIQVVRGLKAGERIVTSGAYAMEDGTKVAVIPPDTSESAKPGTKKPGGN
jgi:RND family efflux transporter MFP subunit